MLQRLDGKGSSTSKSTVAAKKAIAAKKAKTSPVTTESMIGKGMQLAMNQIYDMTLGAGINAATRQGDVSKLTPMDAITLSTMGLGTGMIAGGARALKGVTPAGKLATAIAGKSGGAAYNAAEQVAAGVLLKRPQVAINVPQGTIQGMLANKNLNYGNVFGAPTDVWRGKTLRAEGEASALGVPLNAAASERPVYGYLVSNKSMPNIPYSSAADLRNITQPFSSATTGYGNVAMILKKNATKNATFTYGDSLANANVPGFKAMPLKNVAENLDAAGRAAVQNLPSGYSRTPYLEAQVYGGVDIAKNVKKFVTQYRGQVPELQKSLKDAGLNIKVSSIEKAADNPTLAASKKLFAQMAAVLKKKTELKTQLPLISPEG